MSMFLFSISLFASFLLRFMPLVLVCVEEAVVGSVTPPVARSTRRRRLYTADQDGLLAGSA